MVLYDLAENSLIFSNEWLINGVEICTHNRFKFVSGSKRTKWEQCNSKQDRGMEYFREKEFSICNFLAILTCGHPWIWLNQASTLTALQLLRNLQELLLCVVNPTVCPFNKLLCLGGNCLNPNHSTDLLYPTPCSTQTAAAVGCAQQQKFPWQVLSNLTCYVTTLK